MDPLTKVIQWNCRSINNKKSDLIYLINKYNPFAVSLQETWLRPGANFKIPGFACYREDRYDGHSGVALLVSHSIPSSHFPISHSTDLSIIAVKLNNLCLVSIYIPHPSSSTSNEIDVLFSSLPKPVLIMGDFNAQHQSWGSSSSSYYGNRVLDLTDILNLCILNTGIPTRHTPPNEGISCPDLTLCSPNLAASLEWDTFSSTLGSDHYPIIITFPCQVYKSSKKRPPRLKYRLENTDWILFKNSVETKVTSLPAIQSNNQSVCSQSFAQLLIEVADSCFPKRSGIQGKMPSPPWWDSECSSAIKKRKSAENTYKNNSTIENFNTLSIINKEIRILFKQKKWNGWKSFCSSISPDVAPSIVWRNIRRFRSAFRESVSPYITENLAEQFLDKLAPPSVPLYLYPIQSNLVNNNRLNAPFQLSELKGILTYLKDSSPGIDGIPYSFISHLGNSSLQYFLSIINSVMITGNVPSHWKSQEIIPILKHNKPSSDPSSYRPIALSSVLVKIAEHLIKNRLEWYVESNALLSNSQYGFRKGKSTMDSLSIFTTDIRLAFSSNESVLAAFLDITAAYDNVELSILKIKLQDLHVPILLINFIINLLSERTVNIFLDEVNVKSRVIWKGLPQGSVLSPLLYNIYTYDLELALLEHCNILQYADDLLLYKIGRSIPKLCSSLNLSFNLLDIWLGKNALDLSVAKSSVVLFSRMHCPPPIKIFYKNQLLPVNKEAKFLGIILDSKLSGLSHLYNIAAKCEKLLNILRCLTGVWWGAHPTSLKLLYNALIRSVMDYGSFILEPCSSVGLSKLDSIQSKALRIILGAMKSSPINALQVECVDAPLRLRRQYLSDRFIFRAFQLVNHPLYAKLQKLADDIDRTSYWVNKSVPPLVISFRKYVSLQAPIHRSAVLPIFSIEFDSLLLSLSVHYNININKGDIDAKQNFNFLLDTDSCWRDCHYIFSDASKRSSSSCVGVGVYHQQYGIVQKIKLPPETTIFTGECFGLYKSLEYIFLMKLNKSVIFTDSKSALEALSKFPFKSGSSLHTLIFQCRELLHKCFLLNLSIALAWIPAHHGICGNEKADKLANEAVFDGDIFPYHNYNHDLVLLSKQYLQNAWSDHWECSSILKGARYKRIQPNIPQKPWFNKMNIGKVGSVILSRMRIGHTSCPSHLARFHIVNSNMCVCGTDIGSLNHIFFSCPCYNHSAFFDSLLSFHVPFPSSVSCLLHSINRNIYKVLCSFILENSIRL
jgi:ribonuclease HI